MAAIHSTIHRTFAGIQQPFAGMELGVPPAPTSAYKPIDTIASSSLRDSAAPGGRGLSYRVIGSGRDLGSVGWVSDAEYCSIIQMR